MFNKELSGVNKRSIAADEQHADEISRHRTNSLTEEDALSRGFKFYHPKRHFKVKIITALLILLSISVTFFVMGVIWGASAAGSSQAAAGKQNLSNTLVTASYVQEQNEDNSSFDYGGFCWRCASNSEGRGASWWFGWGACPCHSGYTGACCDISLEPVDGQFSEWSDFGECSEACGYGTAQQTRTCTNPPPKNGGEECIGDYSREDKCYNGPCSADGEPLHTIVDITSAEKRAFSTNLGVKVNDVWDRGLCYVMQKAGKIEAAFFSSMGSTIMYEGVNFVRGFKWWGLGFFGDLFAGKRWLAPVANEQVEIVPYADVTDFNYGYEFMNEFFTGASNPSWEEDAGHDFSIGMLSMALRNADVSCVTHALEPRFEFDHDLLMEAAWKGFTWFDYHETKYASNGDFGYQLVNQRSKEFGDTEDVLGLLMTETAFSAHLTYNETVDAFHLDLSDMESFTPIEGFAPLGGKATFVFDNTLGKYGRLKTASITYGGQTYDETNFADPSVLEAERDNRWIGWRFAEKCIMASLLSQTNLILHVKGLHLELAAAFQVATIDAFKTDVDHPIRRLLDQFTHRSIQATNSNFDLLFQYKAAEFSLAPLLVEEQLKMIDWYIKNKPLSIATMSMDKYAQERNMNQFSAKPTRNENGRPNQFFWRWHYRARLAQEMYTDMINCWVAKNYNNDWNDIITDSLVLEWWSKMMKYLPSLKQAMMQHPDWITNGDLTQESFTRVISTIMTWVSHIHEDVGHSAAYFVYNPIHTPMMVPADGIGIPLSSFAFNTNAYRTFVFLERSKLLEEPGSFWFDESANDKVCYTDMQDTYAGYGDDDDAFSECGMNGFYSCVDAVETSVSS